MRKMGLLAVIFVIVLFESSFAWDDKRTHPYLTGAAIDNSETHDYLKNYLNMPQGIDTKLTDQTVREMIQEGSFCEDQPMCRASNHFHNPHTPDDWTESYMSDESFVIGQILPSGGKL